ncbi:hypothetical protein [Streptomyces tailanensis]|uniref:hypothetical protein n=1 Tax=Streptomyces tailanensis TaxID=2569858 RepID=UPI00122DEE7D|nr:hypothetical protein [Streptomyces tailanensis]
MALADQAEIAVSSDIESFLKAIFSFTTAAWQDLYGKSIRSQKERQKLLVKYFNQYPINGLTGNSLGPALIQSWDNAMEPVRRMVAGRMEPSVDSPTFNPLLALPGASQFNVTISNENDVTQLVNALRDFLVDVYNRHGVTTLKEKAARKLLILYASYGDHWDAVARCTVPLDEPFMIKTAEKRGLHLGPPREVASSHRKPRGWRTAKSSSQLIVWGDAQSNHVSIHVTDTNVELVGDLRALTERHEVVNDVPRYYESTPEFMAFQDADRGRFFRLWLDLPLKTSLPATISRWVIFILTSTAVLAFTIFVLHWFNVGSQKTMSGTDVAVVLVPSAIAASLLLVRETSTLSSELTKRWYIAIGISLVLLWLGILVAYGAERITWG